jgi:hypothetical protein
MPANAARRRPARLARRRGLDEPLPDYAQRAAARLAPWRRAEVDRVVAEELLPRLN